MQQSGEAVSFLASVASEAEALTCASLGADIIDAKNPSQGALGALPLETVRRIRTAVPAHVPVSATIGDPSDNADDVVEAVERMAATGVDIVKIGFRARAVSHAIVRRLGALMGKDVRLVAVLIADDGVDLGLVTSLAKAGFSGVMLDTEDKNRGALPDLVAPQVLADFVTAAHGASMFAGLAGSLKVTHIPDLLSFRPDVLGFRGGLCRAGERVGEIDADAVRAVRCAIPVNDSANDARAIAACRGRQDNAISRFETESAV